MLSNKVCVWGSLSPHVRSFSTGPAKNVGVLATYSYFPRKYVSQKKLEEFDGVSAGKYQIGLGQENMSFCSNREDINSIALSAVDGLLTEYNIDPKTIGRMEVGTETLVDKSKSCKSTLMRLFEESGNSSIEGIDTMNACYGGTNALINALHWIGSDYWDGRNAIVVAGDIAVYEKGPARPTGGAGCVAMLIGPDAPLVFDKVRGTHMEHAWDFYKPNMASEYPVVDGHLSNDCYIRSVDKCFENYAKQWDQRMPEEEKGFNMTKFDHTIFHAPYAKLVQKSYGRMFVIDFLNNPDAPEYKDSPLQAFRDVKLSETYNNRELMNAAVKHSTEAYKKKVIPSLHLPKNCGNTYAGSTYFGLQSLISSEENNLKVGDRVGLFSYGSGLAATLFSLTVKGSVANLKQKADIANRLAMRTEAEPVEFDETLQIRQDTHGIAPFPSIPTPKAAEGAFFPNAWYLDSIDELSRRHYKKVE